MKKLKMKGATWDSVFLTVAKVFTLAFGILLSKIMSTGLSLTEYGTYSQANIVVSIGTSIILLGLGDAVNYFFNKNKNDIDPNARLRVVNTVFFIELIAGAVLVIFILLSRKLIGAYFGNDLLVYLLPIVSVLPVLANIVYFYQVLYISVGKAKLMSVYNFILMIIKIISAYFSVYVIGDILWIYVVLVLLDFIQIVVFKATLFQKKIRINPCKISISHIKPILAYSLPMGVYAFTNILTRDVDKLVIGRLAGTEALAIYTNCSKLLPFDFLVVSFSTVLIPYIIRYVTEKNKEQTVKLFSSYMKIGYYSVWMLASAVLIAPKTIISFLYSDAYTVGVNVFVLYVFDSMLRFASMHLILTAANKSKCVMAYSLLSLGLNLVLNITLYYLFGMIGPAIATLISAIVYTYLMLDKSIKIVGVKWKSIFDIKEILIFVLSLIVIAVPSRCIYQILVRIGTNIYIAMIVSMIVFGAVSLLIHAKKIIKVLKEINSFKISD